MALSADDFAKQLAATMQQVAADSVTSDKAWLSIANAVERITRMFETGWASGLAKSMGIKQNLIQAGSSFAAILRGDAKRISEILQGHVDAISKAKSRLQEIEDIKAVKGAYAKGTKAEKSRLLQEVREREAIQKLVTSTGTLLQKEGFIYFPAIVGSLAQAKKFHEEINKDLIEAGSGTLERLKTMEKINSVQLQTGLSTQELADSTKALVKYGFDLTDNFRDALAITSKMSAGLGASADTTAHMLATTKAIGGSWKEVADGVARVKEDTALSADQAARFATEIGNAMALLGPKAGVQVGAVAEYINRLEGSAQKLGLQAGGMKDVLVGFTTEKGMMGAATLGIDPTFLKDLDKTRMATERFAEYVNKQLAGTTGYQRMVTLQLLAEQFGTTVDVIGRVNEVVAEQNKQRKSQLTMDQVFANQTATLSKQWDRLKNSLLSIMNAALLPLIVAATTVLRPITYVLDAIGKSEKMLWALGAAMTYVMVVQMAKMVTSLRSMALGDILSGAAGKGGALKGAGNILARILGLGGGAAAGGAAATATAARATGWQLIARLLPQIGRSLLGIGAGISVMPIVAIAAIGAAVTGAAYLGYKAFLSSWEKAQLRNQADYVKNIVYGTGKHTSQWQEESMRFLQKNRNLSAAEIDDYITRSSKNVSVVQQAVQRVDKAQAQRLVEGLAKQFNDMFKVQRYRIGVAEGSTIENEQRQRTDRAILDMADRVTTNQDLFRRTAEETAKQQLRELEISRAVRTEEYEWRKNQESALRSVLTNSSPASTLLHNDAGIRTRDY